MADNNPAYDEQWYKDRENQWHEPVVNYDPDYERPQRPVQSNRLQMPQYAQNTLTQLYDLIGRRPWNPYEPIIVGPNASSHIESGIETNIDISWLDVLNVNINNADYMKESFIPTLKRRLEYDKMVIDRKSMLAYGYPTNDLFNSFIEKMFESAIKYDGDQNITRKALYKAVKKFLADAGFVHLPVFDEMLGLSAMANNVMMTVKADGRADLDEYVKHVRRYFQILQNDKGKKDLNSDLAKGPAKFTAKGFIDIDRITYPKHMAEAMTSYYAKIKHSPTDLVHQIMKHNLETFVRSLRSIPSELSYHTQTYIANPVEWALDFVRYAIERTQYEKTLKDLDQVNLRDLSKDPINMPVPMRFAVDINWKFPQVLDFAKLPAEIIDARGNQSSLKTTFKDELWDGKAFMTPARQLPWRNEIAPQLWDTTFFISTMHPKLNRSGNIDGIKYNNDPYTIEHTQQLFSNARMLSNNYMAGIGSSQEDVSSTHINRKNDMNTHHELGRYFGFFDLSSMEGI